MLFTARHFKAHGHQLKLYEIALTRRDFWESREEARASLSARGMKAWDKRVMKLFVVRGTPLVFIYFSSTSLVAHVDFLLGIRASGDNRGRPLRSPWRNP
jgi:hypothetical protein